MSEGRPRRTDALRNRDLILDAATIALARDVDATLIDIASVAGISRATIYRHFSDVQAVRDALFGELEEVGREMLQEHLFPSPGSDEPDATLTEQMLRIIRVALPIETRYSKAAASQPLPEAGLVTTFTPIAAAMIKRGQEQSEFRPDLNVELMAETLIALAFHAARRVHSEALPVDHAVQIIETLLRGMETSPRTTWDAPSD